MTSTTTNTPKEPAMSIPIPDPPDLSDWASPLLNIGEAEAADIVRRSPTAQVARDIGIAVDAAGDGTFTGVCPWCRQREFLVRANQTWTCYGCLEAGRDALVLVAKVKDFVRREAVAWLAWRLSGGANRIEGEAP